MVLYFGVAMGIRIVWCYIWCLRKCYGFKGCVVLILVLYGYFLVLRAMWSVLLFFCVIQECYGLKGSVESDVIFGYYMGMIWF